MVIRRKSLGWQTRSHRLQLQKKYQKQFHDAGFRLTYNNIIQIDLAKKAKGQTYKSGIEKLFKRKTQQRNYRQRKKIPPKPPPKPLPIFDVDATAWDVQDHARQNVDNQTRMVVSVPWYNIDDSINNFSYSEFLDEGNEYFENMYGDVNGYWRKYLFLHIHKTLRLVDRIYDIITVTFNDNLLGAYLAELKQRGFIL